MKKTALLLILSFVFFVVSVKTQTKKHEKTVSKSSKIKKSKKTPRTISFGVMNGKAINLVKPEYPKSAISQNVYGRVSIQILIDESGKVISAKVSSGHLFLQSVAVEAALKSTFEPITLSGEPVRVNGTIIYEFIPHEWNWLEIGFSLNNSWSSYYSVEILLETLSAGFQEEKQLIHQLSESSENRNKITAAIVASISGKLVDNEKSSWLFSIGLILGQMTQNCCRNDEEMQNQIEKIKILLQSKPENISTTLVSDLESLVISAKNPQPNIYNSVESNQIYQLLKNLEQKFLHAGI